MIEDPNELAEVLIQIHDAGRLNGLGNSKIFKDCRFWNATGLEMKPDYPTIYWPKDIEEEAMKLI